MIDRNVPNSYYGAIFKLLYLESEKKNNLRDFSFDSNSRPTKAKNLYGNTYVRALCYPCLFSISHHV